MKQPRILLKSMKKYETGGEKEQKMASTILASKIEPFSAIKSCFYNRNKKKEKKKE